MDSKLVKLLDRLNINKDNYEYFNNAKIDKLVIEKSTNTWKLLLNIESILPYDIYKELLDKLNAELHKNTKLEIISNTNDYSNINDYFKEIIKNISANSTRYNVFENRELDIENNRAILNVYNKIEEVNIESIKDKIEKELKKYIFLE